MTEVQNSQYAHIDFPDADLCTHRVINPEPDSVRLNREEKTRDCVPANVKKWVLDNFRHCPAKEAANCVEVLKKLKEELGTVSASERVAGGIGPTRFYYRAGQKQNWFHYYKHALGTHAIAPVCFK